jgi:Xaa-Pro aminopeptidase
MSPLPLLITKLVNMQYLTGTTCEGFALTQNLKRKTYKKIWLFTDARYLERAKKEVRQGVRVILLSQTQDVLREQMKKLRIKKLGFEAEHMTVARLEQLKKRLRGIKLIPTTGVIEKNRLVKSSDEIRKIQRACVITVKVLRATLPFVRQGVTELGLAEKVRELALEFGAEGLAFDTIVVFGESAAVPHAKPGKRKLKRGDLVLFDLGVKYAGYCSDLSRTFFTAPPTELQQVAYQAVRQAQLKGIATIQVGVKCLAIDEVVRRALKIENRKSKIENLANYFTHSTGHGVGLEIHEAPSLSPKSPDALAIGNVVTVEPGVYLPGKLGIRIEDTVAVTASGAKILTIFPKELRVLQV